MNYRALAITFGVVCAVAVLSGCEVDNSDLVQDSYTAEQHDAGTGLTLTPSDHMWVSFPEVVSIYVATETCMGMTADGPTVEYKDLYGYFAEGSVGPFAFYHPEGYVFMNTYATEAPLGMERDKRTDTEALRHEFVHHILNFNGLDWHHGNPMFEQCGIGVNTYN